MTDHPCLHQETLRGGDKHSFVLKRHSTLRLVDLEGRASVAALFFRADLSIERYNMPDTLKAQYTAFLTAGRVLMSDMGHVLLSITADTCGWHDTISGHQDATGSLVKYQAGTYQDKRNDWHQNSRDNLLIELGKWGLGRRDLHANVNFFTWIQTDDDGRLAWVGGHSKPGSMIELRAEMDVLVVLSNTPHPMDPLPIYAPTPVEISIRRGPPPGPDDPCRISRAENRRAFQLTEALFL